jgi:hypothetical protein
MATYRDPTWGSEYYDYPHLASDNIKICLVSVTEVKILALELVNIVTATSWMLELDNTTRRAYERTVADTASILVEIFNEIEQDPSALTEDFGELMVSLGSARALELIFSHRSVPLAELWKPKLKQNEGFDFHTECPTSLVNFGEAKYSKKSSPHGLSVRQIDKFLEQEKHLRDGVHLAQLCSQATMANLNSDRFGMVAAFSINGRNASVILENARNAASEVAKKHNVEQVFIVGVVYEPQ